MGSIVEVPTGSSISGDYRTLGTMSSELNVGDLDVSARTAGLLSDLGVTTVGELVALPEIRAPKLVLFELKMALAGIGVQYPGNLVACEPTIQATGDIAERWRAVAGWLEDNGHHWVLETFRPPASAEAIAEAERALGRALPEDYKAFLAIHNGQKADGPMVKSCSLFPAESLTATYQGLRGLFESEGSIDAELAGEGVRPVQCAAEWIPIGRSARGRDFLCIDLDPSSWGQPGQIVLVSVDLDERPLVASSFTDLISIFFTQLQTGDIDLER